jgi:hypothetical protein
MVFLFFFLCKKKQQTINHKKNLYRGMPQKREGIATLIKSKSLFYSCNPSPYYLLVFFLTKQELVWYGLGPLL